MKDLSQIRRLFWIVALAPARCAMRGLSDIAVIFL